VEAITPRYRAAVLLAAWCGLRRGEVLGLRREDVDLEAECVIVRRNRVELLATRASFDAEPKTDAGKRIVALPPHVLPVLAEHMASWSGSDRVFVGRDGRPMRGDAMRQAFDRARRRPGCRGSGSTTSAILARPSRRPPARPSRT
jgi:integrase